MGLILMAQCSRYDFSQTQQKLYEVEETYLKSKIANHALLLPLIQELRIVNCTANASRQIPVDTREASSSVSRQDPQLFNLDEKSEDFTECHEKILGTGIQ